MRRKAKFIKGRFVLGICGGKFKEGIETLEAKILTAAQKASPIDAIAI